MGDQWMRSVDAEDDGYQTGLARGGSAMPYRCRRRGSAPHGFRALAEARTREHVARTAIILARSLLLDELLTVAP
jgi:hypothetical protein